MRSPTDLGDARNGAISGLNCPMQARTVNGPFLMNRPGRPRPGGLLKFAIQLSTQENSEHFPLFKEGLREIYGGHHGAIAANPSQSPFKKGEVLREDREHN